MASELGQSGLPPIYDKAKAVVGSFNRGEQLPLLFDAIRELRDEMSEIDKALAVLDAAFNA